MFLRSFQSFYQVQYLKPEDYLQAFGSSHFLSENNKFWDNSSQSKKYIFTSKSVSFRYKIATYFCMAELVASFHVVQCFVQRSDSNIRGWPANHNHFDGIACLVLFVIQCDGKLQRQAMFQF